MSSGSPSYTRSPFTRALLTLSRVRNTLKKKWKAYVSSTRWFGFSPFYHILWHLMKRVLGGEKKFIYCFVFFCSLFCIFGFSFLQSPSSCAKRELVSSGGWVLLPHVGGVLFRFWALALWLFMSLPVFRAQSLTDDFTKWVPFNQKGTDHGVCPWQYAWYSGTREMDVLLENHRTRHFERGPRKSTL